jgi:hypothetical protein
MTDGEFLEELVIRLNLIIEADKDRASAVFGTPLVHARYASVGHFLGQLAMPRTITKEASAEEVRNVKFIVPVVEDQRITRFETVTGVELQARHAAAAKAAEEAKKTEPDPKVH